MNWGLKGGISIDADFGPNLWPTFIQIGCSSKKADSSRKKFDSYHNLIHTISFQVFCSLPFPVSWTAFVDFHDFFVKSQSLFLDFHHLMIFSNIMTFIHLQN